MSGPLIYTSGPHAPALEMLAQHGLRVSDLQGPVGAASGLKMSYAGITKGLTALASAMMLAATRFGAASALAAFAGENGPTRDIYTGIAALYAGLAQDAAGPKQEIGALDVFFGRP